MTACGWLGNDGIDELNSIASLIAEEAHGLVNKLDFQQQSGSSLAAEGLSHLEEAQEAITIWSETACPAQSASLQ